MTTRSQKRSARGRRAAAQARSQSGVAQLPWRQVENPYPPVEPISHDEVEAIHESSLRILEEIGIKVLSPRARGILASSGADVNDSTEIVKFDRGLVAEQMNLAPSELAMRARNPERNLRIGGRNVVFCSVGGPAFVTDIKRGRRQGTYAEQCDYIRLIHCLNIIHQEGGGAFEALDLPQDSRHLDLYYGLITLTDKNWTPWCLGRERSRDALAMLAIALGETIEELADKPPLFSCIINTNSPLQIDVPMAEGLIEMARHGQCITVTPFTLAGAMAPITLAGALAQQNAEALAAIVLAQCVRPGVPVAYGAFTTNTDMRTGAPAFGTPEYVLGAQISGQLARLHRLPFRSSVVTTAHAVDAQAAYESQMALWGAINGHANIIKHAAGWVGGGLTASFEKIIIDAEMLQMIAAYLEPPEVSDATLALEAIRDVGPGGHFFGTAHTLERYETAFYQPLVSDWDNYENWMERGANSVTERAHDVGLELLQEYQQPPIDAAVDEALKDYVDRRKRDIH